MHIHIIRHGQTEFNVGEPRFRGQLDIPLSKIGVQQAEKIASALKTTPLDTIYCSHLQRARITAEKISHFHPKAQFIEEPFLLTLNFGDWQGKAHKDVFTTEERKLWKKGCKYVACLDEAGRGPLAGPVVAAALMIRGCKLKTADFKGLKDSKKLSRKQREKFYKIITKNKNIKWGIGRVSERVI